MSLTKVVLDLKVLLLEKGCLGIPLNRNGCEFLLAIMICFKKQFNAAIYSHQGNDSLLTFNLETNDTPTFKDLSRLWEKKVSLWLSKCRNMAHDKHKLPNRSNKITPMYPLCLSAYMNYQSRLPWWLAKFVISFSIW